MLPQRALSLPFRRGVRSDAAGFLLFEMALVSALVGAMVVGGLLAVDMSRRMDQGKLAGQRLSQMNEAVKAYMLRSHKQLRSVPAYCSTTSFRLGPESNPSFSWPTGEQNRCSITLDGVTIANAFQPTAAELVQARLLTSTGISELGLPHPSDGPQSVKESAVPGGARSASAAAPRFAVLIRCIDMASATSTDTLCTEDRTTPAVQVGTPEASRRYDSLVFNTQPFFGGQSSMPWMSGAQLAIAANTIGAEGFLAQAGGTTAQSALLIGPGRGDSRPNPLVADGGGGAPGVLGAGAVMYGSGSFEAPSALASAAAASAAAQVCSPDGGFMCTDGSAKAEGDWDLNNHSLNRVAQLNMERPAGNVLDNNAIAAMPNNIQGPLLIGGDVRIRNGALKMDGLVLPVASAGASCDAQRQSIAESADGKILFTCVSSKWTSVTAGRLVKTYEFRLTTYLNDSSDLQTFRPGPYVDTSTYYGAGKSYEYATNIPVTAGLAFGLSGGNECVTYQLKNVGGFYRAYMTVVTGAPRVCSRTPMSASFYQLTE